MSQSRKYMEHIELNVIHQSLSYYLAGAHLSCLQARLGHSVTPKPPQSTCLWIRGGCWRGPTWQNTPLLDQGPSSCKPLAALTTTPPPLKRHRHNYTVYQLSNFLITRHFWSRQFYCQIFSLFFCWCSIWV